MTHGPGGDATGSPPADPWVWRYLGFLGLSREAPGRAALDRIVRAHRRITFENLSSLVRRHRAGSAPVPPLDTDVLLERWIDGAAGGVCYEFGANLERLLRALGYACYPILAAISFPGSHSAVMAEIDGERLIVDTGNGQPIFETIAVGPELEIDRAGLRYRFRLEPETDTVVQDRWVDDGYRAFVHYELRPATPEEMETSYQRHHALPPKTFVMESFRLVRCTDDVVLQLRDHSFTRYTAAGRESEDVREPARYRELVANEFALPGVDVDEALDAWRWVTGQG